MSENKSSNSGANWVKLILGLVKTAAFFAIALIILMIVGSVIHS